MDIQRACDLIRRQRAIPPSSLSTYQHIGGVRTTGYAAVPPCLAALIEQLKPRNIGLNGQWASLTNGYGIGHKRADDSFGQACRIAFAFLRQTDDFLCDRCRHGASRSAIFNRFKASSKAAVMAAVSS